MKSNAIFLFICILAFNSFAQAQEKTIDHLVEYFAASTDLCGPVVQDFNMAEYAFSSGYYSFGQFVDNGTSEIWVLDEHGQEKYRIDTYSFYDFYVNTEGQLVLPVNAWDDGLKTWVDVNYINPVIRIKALPEPGLFLVTVSVNTCIYFNNKVSAVSIPDTISVTETPGGTYAEVAVKLSHRRSEAVVVLLNVTQHANAVGDWDFDATMGPMEILPGQISQTASIPIYDDSADEDDEFFTTALLGAVAASEGVQVNADWDSTVVRIVDDDPSPSLAISDASAGEGDSGVTPLIFTVNKTGRTERTATVNYTVLPGTALAGQDYQVHPGGTLTFLCHETEKTVTVNILGDALPEADEQFSVRLSDPVNVTLATSQVTGAILNDDAPILTMADVTVDEGDNLGRFAVFRAMLSTPALEKVTFYCQTAAGTAQPGGDYVEKTRTASEINVGETWVDIPVALWSDLTPEETEIFYLDLSDAQNAVLSTSRATATIVDDDDVSLPVELHSLSVDPVADGVCVTWVTESETDNLGFILERAENGSPWKQIASYETHPTLRGQGNSSERHEYKVVDHKVKAGQTLIYRLSGVNILGILNIFDTIGISLPEVPKETVLASPFPNPFNPQTKISYQLSEGGPVQIFVYDLLGRKVNVLVDETQSAGSYHLYWHGNNASDRKVSTGTYLIVLKTAEGVKAQKVLMMR